MNRRGRGRVRRTSVPAARQEVCQRRGQVLAIVVILMIVVAILVPVMVTYTQRESQWTAKQARATTAFHLAESGIEKGYLIVSQSTLTWKSLQAGTQVTGFRHDVAYSDISGGQYAVSITSGPQEEQATIISVGRDSFRREVRSIRAVYSNSILGGIAIYSGGGVQVGGNVNVHWGAIVSPQNIILPAGGRTYPQIWTAGSIDPYDFDPNPQNCDIPNCHQWHSFQLNIPPTPLLDLKYYESEAKKIQAGCPGGAVPVGSCYYNTDQDFGGLTLNTGATVYVAANLNISSPGLEFTGSLIVTKNMTTSTGGWGKGCYTFDVPNRAWKQYGNNWAKYQDYSVSNTPANFPGINSTFLADADTYTTTPCGKTAVNGMLYIQGSFSQGGGAGNSQVYGAMYVIGTTTMTAASSVDVYYKESVSQNVQTTQIILVRESWKDDLYPWPAALAP